MTTPRKSSVRRRRKNLYDPKNPRYFSSSYWRATPRKPRETLGFFTFKRLKATESHHLQKSREAILRFPTQTLSSPCCALRSCPRRSGNGSVTGSNVGRVQPQKLKFSLYTWYTLSNPLFEKKNRHLNLMDGPVCPCDPGNPGEQDFTELKHLNWNRETGSSSLSQTREGSLQQVIGGRALAHRGRCCCPVGPAPAGKGIGIGCCVSSPAMAGPGSDSW